MFVIPTKSFQKLPSNIFVEEMMDSLQLTARSDLFCDLCTEADATKFCVECAQNICNACFKIHGRLRAMQLHTVKSMEEKLSSQVLMQARPAYCKTHTTKQLKLYCHDCNLTICRLCSTLEHKAHYSTDVRLASNSVIEQLKEDISALIICIQSNEDEMTALQDQTVFLLEQISACEQAVSERAKELNSIVDTESKKHVDELERFKTEPLKRIQVRKNDVERQLLMLSSLRAYVEELVEKGSACAISQSAKDLLARAKQLHADQVEFSKGSFSIDQVTFVPAPDELTNTVVGSIAVNISVCE
jgi:hypothetical protein